ncbi:MAG: hypothetical protein AAGF20_06725 [Pseudomonadota bacterium]
MATMNVSWLGGVDREVGVTPKGGDDVTTNAPGGATVRVENPGGLIAQMFSDAPHYVAVGDNTTNVASDNRVYVPASQTYWLRVDNGQFLCAIEA